MTRLAIVFSALPPCAAGPFLLAALPAFLCYPAASPQGECRA